MTKAELRTEYRRRLKALPEDTLHQERSALERTVLDWCLRELPLGSTLALFGGLPGEPDLASQAAIPLQEAGHQVALFAIEPKSGLMEARVLAAGSQPVRGVHGIWEPDPARSSPLAPEALSLILVPGLFFCPDTGARLGRGGGFYDRYLARAPSARKIGVAFEWQLRPGLPKEAHDQRMHGLLTQQGFKPVRVAASQTAE